jgi:hypothetical protein
MGYEDGPGVYPPGFLAKSPVPEMPGRGFNAGPPGAGISFDGAGPYTVNPQRNQKAFTQGNNLPLILKTFFAAANIVVYMEAAENKRKPGPAATPGRIPGSGRVPEYRQGGNQSRGIGASRQGRQKYRGSRVAAQGGKQPILKTGPEIFRLWQPRGRGICYHYALV